MNEFGLYCIDEGATSLTWNVKVVVALPPEFVAVTVYVAELDITVGVPLITPVTVSN